MITCILVLSTVVHQVIVTSPPLWLYALLSLIPTTVATIGYLLNERRRKSGQRTDKASAQRDEDRREDQLWGYLDNQGIRHSGVVDIVSDLQKVQGQLLEKCDIIMGIVTDLQPAHRRSP